MDLAYLPPLPVGLISAALRGLAVGTSQIVAGVYPRWPGWPSAAVFAAVVAAWLLNSMDWGLGVAGLMLAACLGSLVATAVLVAGWASEPEELERWALRALVAALASALPALVVT